MKKVKSKEKNKKENHTKRQIKWIIVTTFIMIIGLILFKYLPMQIWGKDIQFDASSHIIWTSWGLYVLWFFIDQKKSWRVPYFIFSAIILIIMGMQRIIAKQHNEVGVMLGLAIAFFAIMIPRWKEFKEGVEF
jgi:hypothetical protein